VAQVAAEQRPLLERVVAHLEDLEGASRRRLAALSSRLAALEGASGSLVADAQAAGGRGAAELSACLTAAAGLEAKVGGLERRLAAISQVGLVGHLDGRLLGHVAAMQRCEWWSHLACPANCITLCQHAILSPVAACTEHTSAIAVIIPTCITSWHHSPLLC
jgi:hypothetical protein